MSYNKRSVVKCFVPHANAIRIVGSESTQVQVQAVIN